MPQALNPGKLHQQTREMLKRNFLATLLWELLWLVCMCMRVCVRVKKSEVSQKAENYFSLKHTKKQQHQNQLFHRGSGWDWTLLSALTDVRGSSLGEYNFIFLWAWGSWLQKFRNFTRKKKENSMKRCAPQKSGVNLGWEAVSCCAALKLDIVFETKRNFCSRAKCFLVILEVCKTKHMWIPIFRRLWSRHSLFWWCKYITKRCDHHLS